ncbi:hypothetical protein B296_00023837 [Ensete ventricosum]|uniref:DUF761 domain-containing protein n=1 Tax=Ensete ventricosum TaxID=4639 RepID=A0A426YDB8_ENSVE|nr:hypothetical protein B296_00023837 [Ensete ventricosum]
MTPVAKEKISMARNLITTSSTHATAVSLAPTDHKAPSLRDNSQSNSSRSGKRNTPAANFVARGGDAGLQPRVIAVNKVREWERFTAEEEEEDINEVADAFIRRFREQLRLQRLQSIENYNQMLARGL